MGVNYCKAQGIRGVFAILSTNSCHSVAHKLNSQGILLNNGWISVLHNSKYHADNMLRIHEADPWYTILN